MSELVRVKYLSVWEEGDVETSAILNMRTMIVDDIEVSDEGHDYECHMYDAIVIDGVLDKIGAIVVVQDDELNAYVVRDAVARAAIESYYLKESVANPGCIEKHDPDGIGL